MRKRFTAFLLVAALPRYVYLRKSAAELVLPIAYKEPR
jgi:hypothetical protein